MERGGRDEGPDTGALGDLARELRVGVGDELRAEAEENERQAAQAALRRRRLVDVAAAARDRGETVTVVCGDRRLSGRVSHTARDLLTLATPAGPLHVNLDGDVALRIGAGDGPPRGGEHEDTPSFKARLYELEMAGVEVDLGTTDQPGELRGRIRAVALDHVLVDTPAGERWAVGLSAVRYVRERGGGTGLT